MSEKELKYKEVYSQINSLLSDENDFEIRLVSVLSVLHFEMNFFWTGVYFVKDNELVIGPYQGPIACTRIPFSKGVCGRAYREKRTIVIDDVHQVEDHIACSSLSNSEIVIPSLGKNNEVSFVLDIDSKELRNFDSTDEKYLNIIVKDFL